MLGRDEKIPQIKFSVVQYVILTVFLVLAYGLWSLQVRKSDEYVTRSEQNRIKEVPILAPRGKIYDHWAVSTSDLDATVARLKKENVKFLEEIHPWGTMRAAMIEGPDRIAIELVEVK